MLERHAGENKSIADLSCGVLHYLSRASFRLLDIKYLPWRVSLSPNEFRQCSVCRQDAVLERSSTIARETTYCLQAAFALNDAMAPHDPFQTEMQTNPPHSPERANIQIQRPDSHCAQIECRKDAVMEPRPHRPLLARAH